MTRRRERDRQQAIVAGGRVVGQGVGQQVAVRIGAQPVGRGAEVEGRHRQAGAQRQRQRVRIGLRPDRRQQDQVRRDAPDEIQRLVVARVASGPRDAGALQAAFQRGIAEAHQGKAQRQAAGLCIGRQGLQHQPALRGADRPQHGHAPDAAGPVQRGGAHRPLRLGVRPHRDTQIWVHPRDPARRVGGRRKHPRRPAQEPPERRPPLPRIRLLEPVRVPRQAAPALGHRRQTAIAPVRLHEVVAVAHRRVVVQRPGVGKPRPATTSISARAAAQRKPASECTWISRGANVATNPASSSASRGRYRLARLGRYSASAPR